MKIAILILFLALSLTLPMIVILKNKRKDMIVPIVVGVLVYVLSTIVSNFLSSAVGLNSLESSDDKKTYAVIITLSLTLVVFLISKIKRLYARDKSTAQLVYGGFSLFNLFIYNMDTYLIFVRVGMNDSIEKLEKYYPTETAKKLLDYYDQIKVSDVVMLMVEMVLVFVILGYLFDAVVNEQSSIFEYFQFLIGVFILYYSRYCVSNLIVTYLILLGIVIFIIVEKKGVKKC